MVSEDLEGFLGDVEFVVQPGLVDLENEDGQELPCTGLVDFMVEFAGRSCSVAAWVSPALQNTILIGSMTLSDLGFLWFKDIPEKLISLNETDIGGPTLGDFRENSNKRSK